MCLIFGLACLAFPSEQILGVDTHSQILLYYQYLFIVSLNVLVITSMTEGDMEVRYSSLFVCLFVSMISQKVMDGL